MGPIGRWNGLFLLGILTLTLVGCIQPAPQTDLWRPGSGVMREDGILPTQTKFPPIGQFMPPTRLPGAPILTPTPDPPRMLPTLRTQDEQYIIQAGDTLGEVAKEYKVSLEFLIEANQIVNPNIVNIGQVVHIPAPSPQPTGPGFKIIPDSELVYSPVTIAFDIFAFVKEQGGYLFNYREDMDNTTYTGVEVVLKVAREYSVNPRLLLAVLEYQSGWVTRAAPDSLTFDYPIRFYDSNNIRLYRQLSWAANQLNRGYYLWKVNAISHWLLTDGGMVPANATINAGTAGVQHLMGWLYPRNEWELAVGPKGVFEIYQNFFGFPFDYGIEPLIPAGVTQPAMQLPFEDGKVWSFTGGPHGGWGGGSGWAALDFAPPNGGLGCVLSEEWVTAVADGLVVRSETGVVVIDLDGDGYEQTGWTVLYLHVATNNRVPVGTFVKAGDRLGHPSCEGGLSSGTHVHLARRYNGEWIPADGHLPFNLDGWISTGSGVEYNGTLTRDGVVVEAWDKLVPENQISR